jgi:hypothetical protein
MKRYWPVAASLLVLLAAIVFLLTSGGSNEPEKLALVETATPAATPTVVVRLGPDGPFIAIPRGNPINPADAPTFAYFDDLKRLEWLSKVEEMLAYLSALDGDTTYCGNLCPLVATPAEVTDHLVLQCQNWPNPILRGTYVNFPEVIRLMDVYEDACTRLKSASGRLGKPARSLGGAREAQPGAPDARAGPKPYPRRL